MSRNELSELNDEELKAKCFDPMARRFHIYLADTEEIYRWIMKRSTPTRHTSLPTWTSEKLVVPGLYWHRRHFSHKPVIVLVGNLKRGL